MSSFLNRKLAELAVQLTLPSIFATIGQKIASRNAFHIVILKPDYKLHEENENSHVSILDERAILYEYSHERESWVKLNRDFQRYARSKALVSLRTSKSSHFIREQAPWLFEEGDFLYGGAVNIDGCVVAASGVQWQLDQTYAEMTAAMCKGLSLLAAAKTYALANVADSSPDTWFAPGGPLSLLPEPTKA